MAFIERLRSARAAAKQSHPWTAALRNIRGQMGSDGVERISTELIFEKLQVPPLARTPKAAKQLRGLMVDLGWTPLRVTAASFRGRATRVRGYVR